MRAGILAGALLVAAAPAVARVTSVEWDMIFAYEGTPFGECISQKATMLALEGVPVEMAIKVAKRECLKKFTRDTLGVRE